MEFMRKFVLVMTVADQELRDRQERSGMWLPDGYRKETDDEFRERIHYGIEHYRITSQEQAKQIIAGRRQ